MDDTKSNSRRDPRLVAIPDVHGHAKGEHRPYAEERPIPYTARMLFLWFFHACQRGSPRFMMVSDHINFLTFEDPAAVNLVRRALKLAEAGDLYGASETAGIDIAHAAVVGAGLRRGMRFSIGAEIDLDPRSRPDALNIVEAMRPDAMIRSIHFLEIEHPVHGAGWQWPFDNPEFASFFDQLGTQKIWELYTATVLEAIEKLPGHILGHFYAPAKFGHWPDDATLEAAEDQVLDACAARGMAIEINTRFLYRSENEEQKRRYREANLRFMRKAKAKGIGITIASDAHSPQHQGNGFAQALEMLDEAEINELIFPVNGRMARVALRVTKEHLEQKTALPSLSPSMEHLAEEELPPHEDPPHIDPAPEAANSLPPSKRTGKPATKSAKKTPKTDAQEALVSPKPTDGRKATDAQEALVSPKPTDGRKATDAQEALSDPGGSHVGLDTMSMKPDVSPKPKPRPKVIKPPTPVPKAAQVKPAPKPPAKTVKSGSPAPAKAPAKKPTGKKSSPTRAVAASKGVVRAVKAKKTPKPTAPAKKASAKKAPTSKAGAKKKIGKPRR